MRNLVDPTQSKKKKPSPFDPLEIITDQDRRKVFLQYVNRGWFIFGIVTLVFFPIFPAERSMFIFLMAVIFPTYFIIRFLNISGRTWLAGVIFTLSVNFGFYGLFMVLVAGMGAYKAFETQISVWMLMGLAVLFAGALVEKWAAPVLAALNTVLLVGTRLTIAPDSSPRPGAVVFWWMMALTIWIYETTLHEALSRSQAEVLERRQTEEALRESEKHFHGLYDNATIGMYRTTPGGQIILSNPAGMRMLGYDSFEEIKKRNLEEEGFEPDYARSQFHERMRREGTIIGLESVWKRKDGSTIHIRESATAVKDDNGNIIYYDGTFEDITERKQAEAAHSLVEAQMRANLENTPNVSIQWYDQEGRVLYWNPASEIIYGWQADEAVGKTLDQLIHAPEETAEFKRILDDIRETGKPFGPYESKIRRRDGSSGWVLANTFGIPMAKGQTGFVCMDVDITGNKLAEERLQNQLERLSALHNIDNAIKSSTNLRTTLKVFLNEVITQLKVDAASVLLFNTNTLTLDHAASLGFNSAALQYTKLRFGEGYAGRVILDRKTIHVPDLTKTENKLTESLSLAGEDFIAYVGSPLIAKGQIVGVLEIFQRTPLSPDADWFSFLNILVGQAAIAIDNAKLFENLQRSNFELTLAYDATIEGWSRALDLRDKETEGHTQRVTALTIKLAQQIGVPDAEIVHIRRGALLHDIGKMGVPDRILHKPDKLTAEEWDIMHQHTIYAYEMLRPILYLKPALDIPQYHHEKWDGSGYPHKLKGEDIPLSARIFAVVDVWDAVTSDRPYRKGWSKEKAIEYIKSESGRHFDPKVVEIFLSLILRE